jgi:2-aminoadipate transaminase
LAPSLRIGWIRASIEIIEPLLAYKEAIDLHSSGLAQYILNDYFSSKDNFEGHLKVLRKQYYKKMKYFAKCLDDILPEFKYEKPQGGMFIYGSFNNIDTSMLVQKCIKKEVVFVPGIEFYTQAQNTNEIRFNYTHSEKEDVVKGLKIIKAIIKDKKCNIL